MLTRKFPWKSCYTSHLSFIDPKTFLKKLFPPKRSLQNAQQNGELLEIACTVEPRLYKNWGEGGCIESVHINRVFVKREFYCTCKCGVI